MNRAYAKQLLPLLSAYADGKTIQYRELGYDWTNLREPAFSEPLDRYRIAPDPIERWCVVRNSDNAVLCVYSTEHAAIASRDRLADASGTAALLGLRIVKLKEETN